MNLPINSLPLPPAYYDKHSGGYWYQDAKEAWLRLKEGDFIRFLTDHGYSNKPAGGEILSAAARALMKIQMKQNVDYAGPLAGYTQGLTEMEGKAVLVTQSPKLILPAPGEYVVLHAMLLHMFGPAQLPNFEAWVKLAYESLASGNLRSGHALVMAGQRNSGKTLVQLLVTKILGGRVGHPYQHMTGMTSFTLIETVEDALRSTGLKIGNQVHSLSQEGNRYFGLTEVHGPQDANDYAMVLGLRNSHDKSFPVGLVAGASVFVCDNLSFSGEVRLTRKHTAHLQRDLPLLVASGVGKLLDLWHHQGQRIDAYKNYQMRDKSAHDLVIRAFDVGAVTNRMIPKVLQDWREPSHPEFQDRTAWSLFNSFTEVLKGNLVELPKRTEALHGLFDQQVKLPASHLN